MKTTGIRMGALLLVCSGLTSCGLPSLPRIEVPDIDIAIPTLDVGPVQEKREEVPLDDDEWIEVDIVFGAGELDIEAGSSEDLFAGQFIYNVVEWEPEVVYQNGRLTVQQVPERDRRTGVSPPIWFAMNGNWRSSLRSP